MIELIKLLNQTSGCRMFFYSCVFIVALSIVTVGVANIMEDICEIFKRNKEVKK